jgi:hypothetical protein
MAKIGIIINWDCSQKTEEAKEWLKKRIRSEYKNLNDFLDDNIVEWEEVNGIKIKE